MKKRKQWLMLVCIALAVCLVSGGMLYIRQKNNNKRPFEHKNSPQKCLRGVIFYENDFAKMLWSRTFIYPFESASSEES